MTEAERVLDPIDWLSFEHRQIDRVLVAMSEMTVRISAGAAPKHEFFAATIDFIERYADGSHHAKEESALFEEIWAQGFNRTGPLTSMMSQHELGRDLTRSIKRWVRAEEHSRKKNLKGLLTAATQYTNLIWKHIATEDQIIFPAAKSSLSKESLARILVRYNKVDRVRPEEFRMAADSVVALAGIASL
ncbi:MAG TPA: hemerythrin domain-containing protein [Polyangiaceae bacterium]|jgi:hemerythrin-like domain-containing protein